MNQPSYRASRERLGSLECVVIQPADDRPLAAAGIFCHGFGAGGDDLVGLANEFLSLAATERGLALVFPAAPLSLDEMGMPGGRAWWLLSIQRLITALEEGRFEQVRDEVPAGIDEARALLSDTIQHALTNFQLDASHLLLGGFSQGGMLACDVAFRGLEHPPAQLCLYSTALICEKEWSSRVDRLAHARILQSHGRSDPILPLQTGLWLRDMLRNGGCRVDFREFDGPHTIPYEAIEQTAIMLTELAGQ